MFEQLKRPHLEGPHQSKHPNERRLNAQAKLYPHHDQLKTAPTSQIFVDADACPVKDEVLRVAERHNLQVHYVSNSYMRLTDSPVVNRVIVPEGPDAADDWIVENAGEGDIAITADIPLAARCLEAGVVAIKPNGRVFDDDNIGMALAMRDLKADLREMGEIKGHNPEFTQKDRSNFLQALDQALQNVKSGRKNSS